MSRLSIGEEKGEFHGVIMTPFVADVAVIVWVFKGDIGDLAAVLQPMT